MECQLAELGAAGLVAPADDGWRCTGAQEELVEQLSNAWATSRRGVIDVIFEAPDAVDVFTDAFRIRRSRV